MNLDAHGEAAKLAARIEMAHQRIPKAIISRIFELADNGMNVFEIASIMGLPLALIRLVLRGGAPGAIK